MGDTRREALIYDGEPSTHERAAHGFLEKAALI